MWSLIRPRRRPGAFFKIASIALKFNLPRPDEACNGITHHFRNRMKTQTPFLEYRWQFKPTPGAFSLRGGDTGQAAQAVLELAGDA